MLLIGASRSPRYLWRHVTVGSVRRFSEAELAAFETADGSVWIWTDPRHVWQRGDVGSQCRRLSDLVCKTLTPTVSLASLVNPKKAFLSHFHAFWPRNLEFKSNDQVVTAETWPRILKLAARPQGSVTLSFRTM